MGIYGELQQLNKVKPSISQATPPVERKPIEQPTLLPSPVEKPVKSHDTVIPRHHDATTPRQLDTKQPRHHDAIIQLIRPALKEYGKEAATHRFTLDEKKAIAEVVYNYSREGIKTNENEISRIGVNFLVEDYKANGEKSILHRALKVIKQ